ncbi:hypothetical protein D3Z48_00180 [Clostridiaceae bacterium]|nr:hypothetical protein [Clostridiaceae bacterium]
MDYVLSLSYGKDSLACLGAIEKLGWPLDRIVTVDLWATDTIPADLPPMVEFKEKADKIIKERWGISVEHVRGPHTAEQRIYRRRIRGNRTGEMVGWPRIRGCEIQSSCKREPLSSAMRGNISYWGIAADDPEIMAVGWNQTSVNGTTWDNDGGYDDEAEKSRPYNCLTGDKHFWLFDELRRGAGS